MNPPAQAETAPAPRQWNTRALEKARRLKAIEGWLDNGVLTPIVTGLFSGRGVLFVAPDGDHDGDDQ